ncbi:endonuclease/exonuclease/phosphatase [Nitzschia inconspicua]|uniref:Endonuclease/exonuclease/phosphatase n=1 Tax=Nitzschia inconspicua TaxID=303405 RepID=A0A9K3KTT6_9STRA|nr:endonuclease/exonuclease/phosphatase [Nitzschia inconspicua]
MDHLASSLATKTRFGAAQAVAPRKTSAPPHHHLTLYDFEASPWCRLVREYLTILDLQVHMRPCPRETLFAEGVFSPISRFRPQAMQHLKNSFGMDDLTFPLLVDRTKDAEDPVIVHQSYDILTHLWENYGQSVIPSRLAAGDTSHRRPDQKVNDPSIPFPLRFLLLSSPSYLRPWPRCGLMRFPSNWIKNCDGTRELILYQSEGCPQSRLVREVLCSLEIPYLSIPIASGSSNTHLVVELLKQENNDCGSPTLPVLYNPGLGSNYFVGAEDSIDYLWKKYGDSAQLRPTWLNCIPKDNIGRINASFSVGAYSAFVRGSRDFVPTQAMK